MVRCCAALANQGSGCLPPAPTSGPGSARPDGRTGLEQTRGYQDRPPLTSTQALRMHDGHGSQPRQARIASGGDRRHYARRISS